MDMIFVKTAKDYRRALAALRRMAQAAVVLWLALPALALAQQPQTLPTVELRAGMHRIEAMAALTHAQRALGLMHRREMADHQGMLFVFEQPQVQCFWMKDTYLPLTIAFLADDGTIVNLADMQPHSLDTHCSARPVRHALEMNRGWFARRGIGAGFRLSGGPFGR
jgi:uncharacterized membrane protein (UPF0127 family)